MSEMAYLKSTIQSLEASLALAKAGLERLSRENSGGSKYAGDPSTFDRSQVKAALQELVVLDDFDSDDDERMTALFERALDLEPEKASAALLKGICGLSTEGKSIIAGQLQLNKAISGLRPDVAKDVRAVTEGRGNIFAAGDA